MGKRTIFRLVLAMLAAVLLAGCGTVWTVQPLPQATLSAEEQARFAGTWVLRLDQGAPYMVEFDCAGAAHVAVPDWEDSHFTLKQAVIVIAKGKHAGENSGFLSFPAKLIGDSTEYPLVRYTFVSQADLLIWWPDPRLFAAAITTGRLKGTVNNGRQAVTSVEITATPQAVLDFLDDPGNSPLFDHDNPYLFTKVAGTRGAPAACGK